MGAGEYRHRAVSDGLADEPVGVHLLPHNGDEQIQPAHISGIQADVSQSLVLISAEKAAICRLHNLFYPYMFHAQALSPSFFTVSSITSRSRK